MEQLQPSTDEIVSVESPNCHGVLGVLRIQKIPNEQDSEVQQ